MREIADVVDMIRGSRLAISGVIFSGGEPTMQKDALLELAGASRKMGLKVGVQTNGVFPETLRALIADRLVDKVCLDIKTRWKHYQKLMKVEPAVVQLIRESLAICKKAHLEGILPEFEIVNTLFRGREDDVQYIAREAEGVDLVIQQGVEGSIPPLTFNEIKQIADKLNRIVRIRTREDGEVTYQNNQIILADSIVLTDIKQARRNK
jgi:pyruvate formate lyase activating enzyme